MRRELMDKLIEWKESPKRKPLILEGARQVGKTYLLEEFGRQHFESFLRINLQNPSRELVDLFDGSIEPKRIISAIELMYNTEISPGKTLLFFDEIQEVPRALTSLKYFSENAPEYAVVSAGSLLGIFLHPGTSFPVGQVDTLRLQPMNFKEFLWATGHENITNYLLDAGDDFRFDEILSDALREYLYVGGMPEVVADWTESHNIENVEKIQEAIVSAYRGDFAKYTDETTAIRIRQIFDSLPAQFAKNNDKFLYEVAKSGARARDYEMAIEWLVDAGIIRRVNRVKAGDKIPLKAYEDRQAFKLYFVDLGLFRHLADIPPSVLVSKDAIFDEFNGLIAEQFVLQQLADHQLYYWTSGANSEVDFVCQIGDKIIPIEVKSGKNTQAKSLKVYREKYAPILSVRFSLLGRDYVEGLLNIPLYEAFLFNDLTAQHI